MLDGQTDGHVVSDGQTDGHNLLKGQRTNIDKLYFLSCIFTQTALKHAPGDMEPLGTLAMQIKPKLRD